MKTGLRLTLMSYVFMSYKELCCTLWLFDPLIQSNSTCQMIAIVLEDYFKVRVIVFRLDKLQFNRDRSCWGTFKGKHFVQKKQTNKNVGYNLQTGTILELKIVFVAMPMKG